MRDAGSTQLGSAKAARFVLALTLAVMVRLSWQITALALLLLPIFVLPARRVGARVGVL